MNDITWVEGTFEDLSVHQLYDVMNLRQEVFLIEQNTSYLDADNVCLLYTSPSPRDGW